VGDAVEIVGNQLPLVGVSSSGGIPVGQEGPRAATTSPIAAVVRTT
jgi:hypothetical protein